jgi:tRNA (adenine57-N1/adenine58-N1)-methyltransferase
MTTKNESNLLAYGQPVLLIDRRRRESYTILREGKVSNLNGNVFEHDGIVGRPNGDRVESKKGNAYKVFRTTFQQHALNMQRYATIVYPKDIGAILMHGDIGPGMRVVEGGLGSGALAMALLRAIGPTGQLTTYEIKENAINLSRKNIQAMLGPVDNHTIHLGDIYEGISETQIDRVVLDVPAPWEAIPHIVSSLVDGGILTAYVPTILQVHQLILALRETPEMYTSWCIEILERPWHVTEDSVRPEQRMVAHTGFLVFSRRSARWDTEEASEEGA